MNSQIMYVCMCRFPPLFNFFFSRTPKCPGSYPWVYAYSKLGFTALEDACVNEMNAAWHMIDVWVAYAPAPIGWLTHRRRYPQRMSLRCWVNSRKVDTQRRLGRGWRKERFHFGTWRLIFQPVDSCFASRTVSVPHVGVLTLSMCKSVVGAKHFCAWLVLSW